MRVANVLLSAGVVLAVCQITPFAQAQDSADCSSANATIEGLIKQADPGGSVWTRQECGQARHIQSGLVCGATNDVNWTLNQIIVFPSGPRTMAGQDVACDFSDSAGNSFTLYATNFEPDVDDQDQFDASTSAIQQRFTGVTPIQILTTETNSEDGKSIEPLAAAYAFELDGQAYQTAIWLRTIGDWSVKLRATYRSETEAAAIERQLSSNLVWLAAAQNVERRTNAAE